MIEGILRHDADAEIDPVLSRPKKLPDYGM